MPRHKCFEIIVSRLTRFFKHNERVLSSGNRVKPVFRHPISMHFCVILSYEIFGTGNLFGRIGYTYWYFFPHLQHWIPSFNCIGFFGGGPQIVPMKYYTSLFTYKADVKSGRVRMRIAFVVSIYERRVYGTDSDRG